ncbi:tyrosinase family protein [Pseudomonas fontis]|uniref:Tyrosinase family protein n=1 Tax=Pseudomonas fontis TaxID=2942633 RepID=A0ABT5NTP0_9PSED|nr:tyrosinase family protein [Pseudomonas fontis]MDD0976094.1 tyrosinase family protein [Pseudomonas fontis]MDD0991544.1 tyrosinase family protein [Pseudomonas fontis]
MTYIRRDLWKLAEEKKWHPTLLWYAKAIQVLQQRPITDCTSWRFLAGIHGFNKLSWEVDGYLKPGETLPSSEERGIYWDQCQHSTWFFLPWHRPYALSFEEIVRAAVVKLGGPSDWALPYWDYCDFKQRPQVLTLPPEFYDKTLPDGTPNPLALPVRLRYGVQQTGEIHLQTNKMDPSKALSDPEYTGEESAIPGFGGLTTGFNHDDGTFGQLENQPHNQVHLEVGGTNGKNGALQHVGLMYDPDKAALDPVFWLHHANIDRLWQVWLNRDPAHHNPREEEFIDGPPSDERDFVLPQVDGEPKIWKVGEVLSLEKLGYTYESLTEPGLKQAAAAKPALAAAARSFSVKPPVTELLGANNTSLKVIGDQVETPVRLDKAGTAKVAGNLKSRRLLAAAPSTSPAAHERVFVKLENVRGDVAGATLDVYINLPAGAKADQHPELRAGSVALFGLKQASQVDSTHGGRGVGAALEITDIVDQLHLNDPQDLDQLKVSIVPTQPLTAEDGITIGRISLYRKGER